MLTQIHISNLATIEEAHIDLLQGTTVITGETGAGKSILIEAIELGLGKRASPQLIRNQQDKMELCLCFDLSQVQQLPSSLKNSDFDLQTQECIIRRVVFRDGRSRSYLNDLPITLPTLREFSEAFINIQGQHEHQSLVKPDKQRELLDRFGNHLELSKQVAQLAEQYHKLSQTLASHDTLFQQREQQRDFLQYQLKELEALQIQPEEWKALETEHQQLAHAESLLQNLNQALVDLSQKSLLRDETSHTRALAKNRGQTTSAQDEQNVFSLLHRVLKSLDAVKQVHPSIETWLAAVNSATIQLDDIANEIAHYLDALDLNPERLSWIEERMRSLHELARKYKINPDELLAFMQKIAAELILLENKDESLAKLRQQQEAALQEYKLLAIKLSEKRQQAANQLAKEITQIIQTLALPHAEFHIELQPEAEATISSQGLEKICFLVKTNRGTALHPLAKIASGGELSRISLAIHLATAEQQLTPTLIFDEVDVGIGGGTAELVGRLLRHLGKTHQVLCITHLPQVAAYGNQHISVKKTDQPDQTTTELQALSLKDKVREIARMLGGLQITATTLKHAEEMLAAIAP